MASLFRRSLLRSPRIATALTPALRRSYAKKSSLRQEKKEEPEISAGHGQPSAPASPSVLLPESEFNQDDYQSAAPEDTHPERWPSFAPLGIPIQVQGIWVEKIEATRDALLIKQPGRKEFSVLYHTLRDACKCSQCVDPSTKQRNFRTTEIPIDIKPRSIEIKDNRVVVNWDRGMASGETTHISKYHIDHIKHGVLAPLLEVASSKRRWRKIWNRATIEQDVYWVDYNDFMRESEEFALALRSLSETGLIFVKNIPDSRAEVEKIATRLGPLRNTFYGPTWDVRNKPNAENVAYTNQFLNFHMDLLYMNEPPGFQLLHCLRNSCDGGESLFADTFHVSRSMFHDKRLLWKALTRLELTYEYNHADHFYTNTWPVFEQEFPLPREGLRRRLTRVNYSPPFQASITDRYKDHSEYTLALEALKYFAEKLEDPKNVFELKLEPGQCVIFENRRVVHARRAFNTAQGDRWLAGAYVDEDAVLSRVRTVVRNRAFRNIWHDRDYSPMFPRTPNQARRNKDPENWTANVWRAVPS
ncbi:Clavaminate synthase-like protein [Aspergillus japonicus CBS 114.51]|uniref:Clavaminate synthase-like protein n=2 Tax=Aspergillus TaxID=5052 RepID=A0A2V5HPD7_ASPV1|nr:Clavaminate synthase-like protein [Aspergillus japonicus CBS 114.51]PYI18110.1 Clavaminate synthase-like protein [Aspergillus violaceofuscus CBS 115571]RAH81867.1 Clavaminate synthase-like protein [Aspergillus japonicus CBS 114.51]